LVNSDFSLNIPDCPIIPFIEGDGIGVDITPVMQKVIDAAVEKPMVRSESLRGWKFMRVKNQQDIW